MSYSSPNSNSGENKHTCIIQLASSVMRENIYSVLVKSHSIFVWTDDKHQIKIGEQDAPVASTERGRQVIVQAAEDPIEIIIIILLFTTMQKFEDTCVYCAASVPQWRDTVNHIIPSLRTVKINNGFQTPKYWLERHT